MKIFCYLKVNDMEAFYDNDHFVPCTPPSVDGTTIHKVNHSRRKYIKKINNSYFIPSCNTTIFQNLIIIRMRRNIIINTNFNPFR